MPNFGFKHSKESREKMSAALRKNNPSWRPEVKLKISLSKLGNKNPQWKSKPSYSALHVWVKNRLGKPKKCEECGKGQLVGRQIEWANISGKYERDEKDWKRLCVSCHRKYDFTEEKRKHMSIIGKIGGSH